VGGCATGLLITDPGAAAVRRTYDVDVIAEIVSYPEYAVFSERLRHLGFQEDSSEGAPLCRWLHMQFSKGIHGKWYRMAGKPQTDNATDFLNEIVSAHPQAKKRDWTTHRDRRFEVIGVIVPEENGWRTSGDSVLFMRLAFQGEGNGSLV
jgi:hypothetical protein